MSSVVSLNAGPLTVRFDRFNDRLSHAIGLVEGGMFLPILESMEGSSADPWPVSPPMQQMVSETIGTNSAPVLLGVGLSGNGHWSMAIDANDSNSLKLDIACKISKSASHLGSKYQLAPDIACHQVGDSLELRFKENSNSVRVQAIIGSLTFKAEERCLTLIPTSDPIKAQTHRWCLQIARF